MCVNAGAGFPYSSSGRRAVGSSAVALCLNDARASRNLRAYTLTARAALKVPLCQTACRTNRSCPAREVLKHPGRWPSATSAVAHNSGKHHVGRALRPKKNQKKTLPRSPSTDEGIHHLPGKTLKTLPRTKTTFLGSFRPLFHKLGSCVLSIRRARRGVRAFPGTMNGRGSHVPVYQPTLPCLVGHSECRPRTQAGRSLWFDPVPVRLRSPPLPAPSRPHRGALRDARTADAFLSPTFIGLEGVSDPSPWRTANVVCGVGHWPPLHCRSIHLTGFRPPYLYGSETPAVFSSETTGMASS